MKKLLSCVLTMAMVLSLSVTAFAEGTSITPGEGGNPNPTTGTTNVTYTVDPAYTVTIPATVTLGNSVTVEASGVKVAKDSHVVVKLTGTSGTNKAFTVKTSEGAELKYAVKKGESAVNIGDTILTVNPDSATNGNGASDSTSLSFALDDTVKYAGTYTGTVTFTVSVEAVPAGPK